MNKRLKELRRALRMNQTEFAASIGMVQTSLSLIESGKNSLTEKNILVICTRHNVNEEWLRNGEGPMFKPKWSSEREEAIILDRFRRLNPELQSYVIDKINELLAWDKKTWGELPHPEKEEEPPPPQSASSCLQHTP